MEQLRERLRRWNNRQVSVIKAARGVAAAQEWHAANFLPRNTRLSHLIGVCRALVFPTWDASDDKEPPWLPEKVRLKSLPDDDAEMDIDGFDATDLDD